MNPMLAEFWPYLLLVLAGFLPNEIWRFLGLLVAWRLDEGAEVLVWVRAIATTILAGVVGKLILFPAGALASIPAAIPVVAACLGLLAFFLVRRSVFGGVLAGEVALIAGALLFSP